MRKILLSAALGLAFLTGALHAADHSTPARASGNETGSVLAREQDFGPYPKAVALAKWKAWTRAGYNCKLKWFPSGWYVRVTFKN